MTSHNPNTNHPLLNAPADDQGPGAPADVRDASPAPQARTSHPTGAPVPEIHPRKASVEELAALILHNARAC